MKAVSQSDSMRECVDARMQGKKARAGHDTSCMGQLESGQTPQLHLSHSNLDKETTGDTGPNLDLQGARSEASEAQDDSRPIFDTRVGSLLRPAVSPVDRRPLVSDDSSPSR